MNLNSKTVHFLSILYSQYLVIEPLPIEIPSHKFALMEYVNSLLVFKFNWMGSSRNWRRFSNGGSMSGVALFCTNKLACAFFSCRTPGILFGLLVVYTLKHAIKLEQNTDGHLLP